MLHIQCPYCGWREETEFSCGGEAHIVRPVDSHQMDDAAWADYVFMRKNPKGVHSERWVHTHGCRKWFNMCRHTVSHKVLAVYKAGDPQPDCDG